MGCVVCIVFVFIDDVKVDGRSLISSCIEGEDKFCLFFSLLYYILFSDIILLCVCLFY